MSLRVGRGLTRKDSEMAVAMAVRVEAAIGGVRPSGPSESDSESRAASDSDADPDSESSE